MEFFRRTLLLVLGGLLGCCAPYWVGSSPWANSVLTHASEPWTSIGLYYAGPIFFSLMVSSILCRFKDGPWLLMGSLVVLAWLLQLTWDSHLRCGVFGGCGTGQLRWRVETAVLPILLGQLWALCRACRVRYATKTRISALLRAGTR